MMLAGAEAIAGRAQPPGKGGSTVSLKNCQIQFVETDSTACILGALVICDQKWLRTQLLFLLTMHGL